MVTKELADYINNEIKEGKKDDEIKKTLSSEGWKSEDVESAFNQLNQKPSGGLLSKISKHKIPLVIIIILLFMLFFTIAGMYAAFSALSKVGKIYNLVDDAELTGTLAPSPKITITGQSVYGIDCGTENFVIDLSGKAMGNHPKLECFINNSKTCTTSSLKMINSIDSSGIKTTSTISYKISKESSVCKLDINQGDISYSLPVGVPEELLDPILAPIKKLENTDGVCIFNNNGDLVRIFENLNKGDFSMYLSSDIKGQTKQTEMYISGNCSGTYFDALK